MQLLGRTFTIIALQALSSLAYTSAIAQTAVTDWPKAKPVSVVVGFAAGAFTDNVARILAQKLGETTGGCGEIHGR